MSCVIFNSAAPAAAGPTRRGATAQEEKRSPTRTTARNPNVRSFTVTIPGVARGKRLKAARRELCRIIRHLGSAMQTGIRGGTVAAATPQRIGKYRFSVEAAVSAAKTIESQAARLPPQISRDSSIIWAFGNSLRIGPSSPRRICDRTGIFRRSLPT